VLLTREEMAAASPAAERQFHPERLPFASPAAMSALAASPSQRRPSPQRGSPTPVRNLFPASPDSRQAGEGKKEVSGVGSSLLTLIEKVYKRLDPEGIGYLTNSMLSQLPPDLTPFEASLIDLCHNRLVFQMERGGYKQLPKQDVLKMLCQAMEADFAADPKDGGIKMRSTDKKKSGDTTMPLETAMRSVYREARKQRSGKFGYVKEDPASVCTFKPAINKLPPESSGSPVKRVAPALGQLSRPMSTRDMQEYVALQECTFQPNLHKMVIKGAEAQPRYRSKRRTASPDCPERYRVKRGWDAHLRTDDEPPALSTHEQKEKAKKVVKAVDSPLRPVERPPMDLGTNRDRYDSPPKSPRKDLDWGKYIRVRERRFAPSPNRKVPELEDDATRHFAAMFLQLRQSHTDGWNLVTDR